MMPKAQSMQRFSKIFNATIVNETLASTISTVIHVSELPLVTGRIRTKLYWKKNYQHPSRDVVDGTGISDGKARRV